MARFHLAGGVREDEGRAAPRVPLSDLRPRDHGNDTRACLYYDIKLCGRPASARRPKRVLGEHQRADARAVGHAESVLGELRTQMEEASEALDFERAAMLRDRMRVVAQISARQRLVADSSTPTRM